MTADRRVGGAAGSVVRGFSSEKLEGRRVNKGNLNAKAVDGGVGTGMELCEVVQESRWWSRVGGGNGGGVEF